MGFIWLMSSFFRIPGMKPILNLINTLYMATIMEKNISWFVISGILKNEDINQMKSISADLCAQLGPQALAICESFGITDTMLSAPIALDWVGYNSYDNQGEKFYHILMMNNMALRINIKKLQ